MHSVSSLIFLLPNVNTVENPRWAEKPACYCSWKELCSARTETTASGKPDGSVVIMVLPSCMSPCGLFHGIFHGRVAPGRCQLQLWVTAFTTEMAVPDRGSAALLTLGFRLIWEIHRSGAWPVWYGRWGLWDLESATTILPSEQFLRRRLSGCPGVGDVSRSDRSPELYALKSPTQPYTERR